jgi:D-serine deaminase-like pyridoxal phosphate-dependent protein
MAAGTAGVAQASTVPLESEMHPAAAGRRKEDLETPALLVDLDRLERNVARMAQTIVRDAGVSWRPHVKGIKAPALVRRLLGAGAHGVTCAKLGEAEAMAAAGVRDILIANQVVGAHKAARLARLRQRADVMVAVDGDENAAVLDRAAQAAGVRLRVVIEVDVGMGRAGVLPGEPVLALAQRLATRRGLDLAGVMTWESPALAVADPDEKRRVVREKLALLVESVERCRAAGLAMPVVSCGGTGTYWLSAFAPGVTEVQAGGGVLCDLNYRERLGVPHELALTVQATVTSRPTSTRIICDAGRKALSTDAATPRPVGLPAVKSVGFSAEHGKVELAAPSATPRVGDTIEFVVGYADTTVLLHDEMYAVRDGVVEEVWPLLPRSAMR